MGGVAAVGVDEKERKSGAANGRCNGRTGKASSDAKKVLGMRSGQKGTHLGHHAAMQESQT